MKDPNGTAAKLMGAEWPEHRDQATAMSEMVTEVHGFMGTVAKNTEHLSKLECLERIEKNLLAPATGENRINKDFVMLIVKILGFCWVVSVLTIGLLLTGEKFGIIGALHR